MTEKTIDYFYTPISPFAYLGAARFRALCDEHGVTAVHKPIDLGKIFPVSGGVPVAQRAQQRQSYRLVELKRWSDYLDLPMILEPEYFPVPAHPASHLIIAAVQDGHSACNLAEAIMNAVWVEDRDISNPTTLAAIADDVGLPGEDLLAKSGAGDIAHIFQRNTDEAISIGIFGAPTYSYQGELFWGQDRLDFLARALSK